MSHGRCRRGGDFFHAFQAVWQAEPEHISKGGKAIEEAKKEPWKTSAGRYRRARRYQVSYRHRPAKQMPGAPGNRH